MADRELLTSAARRVSVVAALLAAAARHVPGGRRDRMLQGRGREDRAPHGSDHKSAESNGNR